MAPKRPRSSSASSEEKKKKRYLTVSEKVRLLDLLKSGKRYSEVAKQYGLNESTVRYIRKDEENIRKTAALSFNKDTKRLLKGQNKTVIRMENALSVWIQDCRTKKISIDTNVIRAKAKALYDTMVPEGGAEGGDDDPQDDDDNAEEVDDPQPSSSGQSTSTPSGQSTTVPLHPHVVSLPARAGSSASSVDSAFKACQSMGRLLLPTNQQQSVM